MRKNYVGGYMGNVLNVDLSSGRVSKQKLSKNLAKNYIGGRGLNSKVLYDMVPRSIDAFDPRNLLLFSVGPLNGTLSPSSSRWTVTSKSPLTGILGDANSGSGFGAEMKHASFDQMIIKGRAEKPVYLWIENDKVEIKAAHHLWGETTDATEKMIKEDLRDRNIQIACIGPAGENLVRFACIMSQGRAAARTGMGAVMGSKNLKAIAIRGDKDIRAAKMQAFEKAVLEAHRKIKDDPVFATLSKEGTPLLVNLLNKTGTLTTKNGDTHFFEEADEINAEAFLEHKKEYAIRSTGCSSCVINCTHNFTVKEGSSKLEFVNLCAYGSYCLNSNLPSILKATVISNQLGIDIYSMGGVIGFAMECYEKGILTGKETGGLELEWGNYGAMIELIKLVAHRKGLGNVLAEGVKTAAEKIGKGAAEAAQHTKGLEQVSGNGVKKGYILSFATSTRGFDHLRGLQNFEGVEFQREKALKIFGTTTVLNPYTIKDKPLLIKWHQDLLAVADSLEICKFNVVMCYSLGPEELAELYSAVTGWPTKGKELMRKGERIYNIERMFNVREGITRKDDTLPSKMFNPIQSGPTKGRYNSHEELDTMLDEYYMLRGWSRKTGKPSKKKLNELGIF